MEKNIVKNGARVISFAPDDESANILGTVTSNYEFNGTTCYDKMIKKKVKKTWTFRNVEKTLNWFHKNL